MGGLRRLAGLSKGICILAAVLCAAALSASSVHAEERVHKARSTARAAAPVDSLGQRINSNTLAIVSGNINGTYLTIAYDFSAVLDNGDDLRILPVIGKGATQNFRDVRFLRGVDLGITQSNLFGYFRRTRELGPIDDKIVYIAKLFNEEMHFVVRSDVTTIEQLRGKKVNFSDAGSGTQLSTRDVFDSLAIPVEEVNMGQADAFEKIKSGEIAATILIAGKPARSMATLKLADGFRILPVPYVKALQSDYLPSVLAHDDYPNLIEPGRTVDTIAVGAVLIAYNWPQNTERYRRIAKFVGAFFPRLADFQKAPRHPKWLETNLASTIPGLIRFPAAEEWLKRNRGQPVDREEFEKFLAATGTGGAQPAALTPENRERLFQEFLKWNQARERR